MPSRSPSPARAPRRTSSYIVRAALVTAIGLAGVAALVTADRDRTPTSATGTTAPAGGTAAAGATATSLPASSTRPGPATTKKAGSSATTAAPPTTAAKKGSSTSTSPASPGSPGSPEDFARELYQAWKSGSRKAAASVATPAAVDTLFAKKPAPIDSPDGPKDPYAFTGCTGAAGSEVCRFDGADGTALVMKVRTGTGGLPMMVTEVRFPPPGE